MRTPNNKRARGRPNRRAPNPNRSYESNGPEGKIRGNANQVYEKYSQLARDAQASGDPIAAEGFWQYAEHYYRIMLSQQQARQQMGQSGESDQSDDDDNDDSGDQDQADDYRRGRDDSQAEEPRRPRAQPAPVEAVDPSQLPQPDIDPAVAAVGEGPESETAGLERMVRRTRGRRPRRPRGEGEAGAEAAPDDRPEPRAVPAEDAAD
ncbi:MAG: DUF4167 domain-containing protein [Pseudomonadota bacterium]|nr:DUF4167 domain-containing protein [Pseudomonadota bacterium]